MEVSGQLHETATLPPGKEPPGKHCIGGWVDPRAGLDKEKLKLLTPPGLELRPFDHPSRSQSLYRLSYRGSWNVSVLCIIRNSILRKARKVNFFYVFWFQVDYLTMLLV
jgi:hypothetical protein